MIFILPNIDILPFVYLPTFRVFPDQQRPLNPGLLLPEILCMEVSLNVY